jgi:hypothetical protein
VPTIGASSYEARGFTAETTAFTSFLVTNTWWNSTWNRVNSNRVCFHNWLRNWLIHLVILVASAFFLYAFAAAYVSITSAYGYAST